MAACADHDSSAPPAPPDAALPGIAANCNAADGPIHPYTQASEVQTLVVGRWIRCSGTGIFGSMALGIEFDADGTYFMLGDDGHGGAVKLMGFDAQGTWDVTQETPTTAQLNIHSAPNAGNGGAAQFEDAPRKFALDLDPTGECIYAIAFEPR
jgi:hypothetical protein